jgi:putative CocE/NonD family hydrolase
MKGRAMGKRSIVGMVLWILILGAGNCLARSFGEEFLRDNYEKREVRIKMRDGVKLFTAIYTPRDRDQEYPILLKRTPYGVGPYGETHYPNRLGPNPLFDLEKFIFVLQDVRGTYMSEGHFADMRPQLEEPASPTAIDESTDAYDTIEWLVTHLRHHNGKVGMWGISYPGFYAAAGMIHAHPALAAVSPQAPIADWFYDDFHHHGAFFLAHAFGFLSSFGIPRKGPTRDSNPRFDFGTPDGYEFFKKMGPLKNAQKPAYLDGRVPIWTDMTEHPNYDKFWQSRNLLPHLEEVAPAVLIVGGWFDAEDLYGPLKIYRSVEAKNPSVFNVIVMGPWSHGAWARQEGERLGNIAFGSQTSVYFRENLELPFFKYFLKGGERPDLPEASMFETGTNRWRTFDHWPPSNVAKRSIYLGPDSSLTGKVPAADGWTYDEYVSDPGKPVPFTEAISPYMTTEYMTDDQRFAGRRPDVLVYQTQPLEEDLTLAGPIKADLWVSTSGTSSDWIVKLIDVFPDHSTDFPNMERDTHLGNYQMMVRSEVLRGRFRNTPSDPEPFAPDQPTRIQLELLDVLHTFQQGHRVMIQVQSSWFPLVDINPQSYVDNVYKASPEDFIPAQQRIYRSSEFPSHLEMTVLPAEPE